MKKYLLTCFALVFALSVWAQDRTVSGKVTSTEDGSALPGVNVVIKGTTNGTVTDSDGNYKLSVAGSNASLVFSFIGLQTAEVPIGERSVVDVSLGLDVTQLSEIIVTGTGVATEKRKLAISVESITADKLPAAPTASIDQALVGKIAGAQISSVSGTPGAQAQILLRGINTIQGGTTPMILVDGVQMLNTNLNSLDFNSIEKVEVVQGAAAATIYGAQGANGVIQLFTKRGKVGKMSINLSSSVGVNEYLNIGNVEKAKLHAFATDASGNVVSSNGTPLTIDPLTLQYSANVVYDALNPASNANKPYGNNLKYVDHFDQFLQKANTYINNINLSGAKEKFDYSFSASNIRQESNIKNGGYYDRTNFVVNLGTELAKGLTFRSTTQLIYTKSTVNSYIYGVFNARPFVDFDLKNSQGYYSPNMGGASGVNGYNPNYFSSYTDRKVQTVDVMQNFNLNYKFAKFVELDTKYGLQYQQYQRIFSTQNESNIRTSVAEDGSNFGNYLYQVSPTVVDDYTGEIDQYDNHSTFQNWISKATANFDLAKDFNSNLPLKFSTLLLFDYRKNVNVNYATYAQGLPIEPPFTAAYANTFRVRPGSGSDPITGTVPFITYGYLVNQRIDYGDIGGISGGFRSDYSSAFGAGSKPFTFPRGDAYVRISGFDFWDNSGIADVLLEWKIRAAYGQAGNQPRPFDRYVTLSPSTIGGVGGLKLPVNSSNPDLNVEVSTETEFGTDMTFNAFDNSAWANNISLSATYWERTTSNAIFDVDIAPSIGVGTQKTNAFGLSSQGLQASLSTKAYHNDNFSWNFTANFTKSTSKITSVLGGVPVVLTSAAGSTGYVLEPGLKVGQLSGYIAIKSVNQVDPTTGQPYIPAASQPNYSVASNGWVVNTATKQPFFSSTPVPFGDPNPKFLMSFINDLQFKSFLNVGFQFDWVQGSHLYNQTKEWMYRDGIHADYNTPLTINGETGNWTAFYRGVYAQVSRNGTKNYFYEDASFVRLRNVNVSLDFAKLFKIPGFTTLQLVFTGRNLWTHTKYTGFDPEISSGTTNSSWDRAVDHNTLPNFKTYQVGLNIGF